MEAVGTLAGGVAHDFNNILQVVWGYAELMLADEQFPQEYRNDLGKVLQVAQNGADLIRQLLTFSRQAEFQPRPVNLNRRIEQLEKMLSRTIPRMISIDLVLGPDVANIEADQTQVDQVLMNLAVNARDAMPEGGRLTIETCNLNLDEQYGKTHPGASPGHYVKLSVSDMGHGMDKETLERVFEPFFSITGVIYTKTFSARQITFQAARRTRSSSSLTYRCGSSPSIERFCVIFLPSYPISA